MVQARGAVSRDVDHQGGSSLRTSISLLALGLGFALGTVSPSARADDDPDTYPLPYSGRPMTLLARTLSPYVAVDVTRFVADPRAVTRDLTTSLTVQAGAKFGLSNDFEVDAALAQIRILPALAYGDPTLGATFRVVNSVIEIGVRAQATIFTTPDTAGIIAEPSVPFLIHLGGTARLDFSAGAPIALRRGALPIIGLDLPVAFALNPIDNLYVGAKTSVYIVNFRAPGETVTVPLGLFAGVTIGTDSPLVEIAPFFTWPQFAQPGVTGLGKQKLNTDIYTAGLSVRGFFSF
jgi:hypothetical protein